MCSQPCSLPAVSLLAAPGCLSFPSRTQDRRILINASRTDVSHQAASFGTGAGAGTRARSAGGL